MKLKRRLFVAAFVGAALVMSAYALMQSQGQAGVVRTAWMDVVPHFFSLLALLGVTLTLRKPEGQGILLVNAAFAALLTHAFLVLQTPLGPGESGWSRVWPLVDLVGYALLPTLLLVLLMFPMTASRAKLVFLGISSLGMALAARAIFLLTQSPTVWRGVGTTFALLGAFAAIRLGGLTAARPAGKGRRS